MKKEIYYEQQNYKIIFHRRPCERKYPYAEDAGIQKTGRAGVCII